MSRYSNRTIYGLKELLGLEWNEYVLENHIPFDLINKNNNFYWKCGNNNENNLLNEYEISIEKIYSIYFDYIKAQLIESDLLIFSYPLYYTEKQKSIFSDLCNRICNKRISKEIKIVIIPENLSIGLTYGYENNNSYENGKEYPIIIIDIGNCCSTFSLLIYRKV